MVPVKDQERALPGRSSLNIAQLTHMQRQGSHRSLMTYKLHCRTLNIFLTILAVALLSMYVERLC